MERQPTSEAPNSAEACDGDLASDAALASMVPTRFSVRDENTADWLVRKLVEADVHVCRVKQQAEREIRRTQREREFLFFRFGRQLETWAAKELANHKGRRKSLLLLSGTVGFRSIADKLVLDDETIVLSWAKRHCRKAVVVSERLSKTALNEHVAATGELPKGAHLEGAAEKFYVK